MCFSRQEIREAMQETITELSSAIKNNPKATGIENDESLFIHDSLEQWAGDEYLKDNIRRIA